MRLAKLCITLALALGGWHAALANALCARHADCHAAVASPRAPHAGHETPSHAGAHAAADEPPQAATHAADEQHRAATPATPATDAPANDPANHHGHCDSSAGSAREVAHVAPHDAGREAARGDDENVPPAAVTDLRTHGSPCGHCVVRQSDQPARVKSAAPAFARDAHAAPVPARHFVTPAPARPRPRLAPPAHSPPRGRPLHLLNSALLI